MIRFQSFTFLMCLFFTYSCCSSEAYIVSDELKIRIERSPFKLFLHQSSGKEIIAYLFAEDETVVPEMIDNCSLDDKKKSLYTVGHYYLYLYDVSLASFFPYRTEMFKSFENMKMNINGSDFLILPKKNKNQPNVILISQFVTAEGNQYEAYGFFEGDMRVKRYMFSGEKKQEFFYGKVYLSQSDKSSFIAHSLYNGTLFIYALSISDNKGEINVQLIQKQPYAIL